MTDFTGKEYLKIDVANAFGLDKKTWQERLDWFDTTAIDVSQADEVYMATKAMHALIDADRGIPTGHVMYLDATFSGAQFMACLTGCEVTARNNNLIDTGRREDGYTNATLAMNKYVDFSVDRSEFKYPCMTTFYGSKAKPMSIFGEGTPELAAFYKALQECFPGACEYLADVQQCWQGDALYHQWTMPDGVIVRVLVQEKVEKKIEIDELGTTFTHIANVNQATEFGISLAANIIQAIDAWVVREMIRRANAQGFELLTIFDAFGASPIHMNKVRQNYREILSELAAMDLLGSILSEITGTKLFMEKASDRLPQLILESEYALS